MKIAVISYSISGNNLLLAKCLAKELSAEHIKISENKKRNAFHIMLDIVFNRTPKINAVDLTIKKYDLVLLVGPVWMGKLASPLRAYCQQLKNLSTPFAFISISGGSNGGNPQLEKHLTKRVGRKAVAVIDKHIVDLLPQNVEPTLKMVQNYRLTENDGNLLCSNILVELKEKFPELQPIKSS